MPGGVAVVGFAGPRPLRLLDRAGVATPSFRMARVRHPVVITPETILRAYAAGLFPMAEDAEDDALFWVDPERRGVFPLDGLHVSRSLAKRVRSDVFAVVVDRDFDGVVAACAEAQPGRPDTWINVPIRRLFGELFRQGRVHTVEAYRGEQLVGGLYGLHIGGAFFGESMFHRATDASKVCLVHLAARLAAGGFILLDTQFITPHLATLGAVEIPKADYLARLAVATRRNASFHPWGDRGSIDGATALSALSQPP